MNTQEQLTQVFNDNFVAYYRAHLAHVNIVGRNFYSDHKLLEKIYESLQDQIDTIAELLRAMDEFMPVEIQDVLNQSHIGTGILEGSSDDLLSSIMMDLLELKEQYEELMRISETEGYEEIGNYSQDRILALEKQIWMLRSTLE